MAEYPVVRPPGAEKRDREKAAAAAKAAAAPEKPVTRCRTCGGQMTFDPVSGGMACPFCENRQAIPKREAKIEQHDLETWRGESGHEEESLSGAESEITCGACNADVLLPEGVAPDACPFCGSPLDAAPHAPGRMLAPGGVLPFRVEKESAVAHFVEWANSLWFAPNIVKRLSRLQQIRGVYIPMWSFQAFASCQYEGQRGDDEYLDAANKRTHWSRASGLVSENFRNLLVPATDSLPLQFVNELEPWDVHEVVPYEGAYLRGFQTERYKIPPEECQDRAAAAAEKRLEGHIRYAIGGDRQRITSRKTHIDDVKFQYLLMPVWVAAYRYDGKPYRLLINARTGEVIGDRPWSLAKIAGAVAGGLIGLVILAHLLVM